MAKIDRLIRELRLALPIATVAELETIFAKYAGKPAKRLPPVRKQPEVRVGKLGTIRLKGSEMEKLRHAAFERASGTCELHCTSIRTAGDDVLNFAANCPTFAPSETMETRSITFNGRAHGVI